MAVPALTTTFTPSPSCLVDLYQYPYTSITCYEGTIPVSCQYVQLGPPSTSACFPPGWSPASTIYFSPGICPSGYGVACAETIVTGTLPETRATCCPSGYYCQTALNFPWYTIYPCVYDNNGYFVYTTSIPGTGYATSTGGAGGGFNAYGVKIRWRATNLSPEATSTSSTTSVSNANTGLSLGAKIGIGVGVGFAGILCFIALLFLGVRHRRQAKNRTIGKELSLLTSMDSGFGRNRIGNPESRPSFVTLDTLNDTIDKRLQYMDRDQRVRIAVLDTGFDQNHENFKQARPRVFIGENEKVPCPAQGEQPQIDRIKQRRNFCIHGEGGYNEDTNDLHGHGTAVAGIILRLAPHADLYIARVCKNANETPRGQVPDEEEENFEKPQPITVAKAVEWAIEEEVHIINLSFGFWHCAHNEVKDLREALKKAKEHNIVVFAATCINHGVHEPVAWPASDPELAIGIHSADDFGNKSEFTALHFDGANFMVLGQNILSQWPSAEGGGFRLLSGTSYATAVATAMAALVLAFTWQTICRNERANLPDVPLGELQTNSGMTKVLKKISTPPDNNYRNIRPKLFWHDYNDGPDPKTRVSKSRGHAWNIIETALRI
ncbi:subtilisin-like protein [Hyaloscypha variabilis F]|uniref:Subtilisin-like protein n=1 Tax=Hyaloscypha variabilis (strain UAMH 11265 / GT02V1 / F) TaxID=1149755 RepID=A0A2J6SAI8_HYAVF|nr:subtilisin-like protein [Hyaloscypha variabilis F]